MRWTAGAVKRIASKKGLHTMAQHFLPPTERATGKQANILIIENDRNNRILMENVLRIGGYQCVSAAHGQEALELLDQGIQVDLVLTDLSMPVLDGYQAAQMIREKAGYKELPIIAVTGYALSEEKESALAAGCNEYLTKPFRQSELLALVARLLRALPAREAGG
jgi:CheY-like chemotaxis protein